MATSTKTSVNRPLITLDEVGEQLGLRAPIEVKRLIAKGLIKGQQLPNGEWKIAEPDLKAYVAGGLQSAKPFPYDGQPAGSGWLQNGNMCWIATQFENGMMALLKKRWPTNVRPLGRDESSITIDLTPDSAMLELIRKPVNQSAALDNPNAPVAIRTWGGVFAAVQLHALAQRVIRKLPVDISRGDLAQLYRDPQQFEIITNEAIRMFEADSFRDRQSFGPDPKDIRNRNRPVMLRLPMSALGINFTAIIQLAF